MFFSKKYDHPGLAHSSPTDEGSNCPSDDPNRPLKSRQASDSELMFTFPRLWKRKKASTAGHICPQAGSSKSLFILPSAPEAENPTPEGGVRDMPVPIPIPCNSGLFPTDLATMPPSGAIRATIHVPDGLADAWDAAQAHPTVSDMSRALDSIDDTIDTTQRNVTMITPLIVASVSAAEQSDAAKVIKGRIDRFSEGMPVLLNALDELASLHPFIKVVVLAFKVVYTLEQNRRDNDRKVTLLYAEMKDMMGVLLLLKDVKNDKLIAPDGTSIKDRLESLVTIAAKDIKACSNMCDAYMKKRLLAKVLSATIWNARLLELADRFAQHRQKFEFELTVHITQSVDKANLKLDAMRDEMKAMMNDLKYIFPQLASTEENRLSVLVRASEKNPQDDNDIEWFVGQEKSVMGKANAKTEGGLPHREKRKDLEDNPRKDIFEDPNTAAEKNLAVFSRKFEEQKTQILNEVTRIVERVGDRVVREVNGRAHERIRDGTIHEIWVEMGWRGSVKDRHFVLALRDYYLERPDLDIQGISTSAIDSDGFNPDAWAIPFVDLAWLQPISEAFDDDASGFITTAEVNRFTSSRPADWSLPHWLAFWAVGFRSSIIDYSRKIEELFAKMEGIRGEVLRPNREFVDSYFTYIWKPVHKLTAATPSPFYFPLDPEKFKPYLEAEEARLSANLKGVNYFIDGIDTLPLITGVGRIEKTVFPLLYLLMKRHYEIMRIMRTKIPDPREIWEGVQSIFSVCDAVTYRVGDLTNYFSHQKMDPEKQFQSFAYGIFEYYQDSITLFSPNYVQGLSHQVTFYEDDNEDQNVESKDVLNYDYKDDQVLDLWVYDGHSVDDMPNCRDVESPLKDIFGHWHGYFYEDDGTHLDDGSMMTIVLEPADGEQGIRGNAWSCLGRSKISGSWSKGESGTIELRFKISSFDTTYSPFYLNNCFDSGRNTLTGVWGTSEMETSSGKTKFHRVSPHHLTAYPSIKDLTDSKPRALWKFAIAAVKSDIRREHWSWSYFSQRRLDRITTISLTIRYNHFGTPLGKEEIDNLNAVTKRLTSADVCFYGSIVNRIRADTWIHTNAYCDSCRGWIGGARLLCLDCVHTMAEDLNDLDLCCETQCIAARITHREDLESAHEPNHRLIKARIPILVRHYGRLYSAACKAFERIGDSCARIMESSVYSQEGERVGSDEQKASSDELNVAEMPTEIERFDNGIIAQDGTTNGAEADGVALQGPTRVRDKTLLECGKCKGCLSFPCWYCIYCEDDLFICDACDRAGVPDLIRSSGKHIEDHHLIRCQAPEEFDDPISPTEQRLLSLESRFDGVQTHLEDLSSRMGDLAGYMKELNARIGNIEQLLRQPGATE